MLIIVNNNIPPSLPHKSIFGIKVEAGVGNKCFNGSITWLLNFNELGV